MIKRYVGMFLLVVSDIKKELSCEGRFLFYFFDIIYNPSCLIPISGDTLHYIYRFSNYL